MSCHVPQAGSLSLLFHYSIVYSVSCEISVDSDKLHGYCFYLNIWTSTLIYCTIILYFKGNFLSKFL